MKYAVNALIFNKDKQLLAVSRKDDPTDFGLPGGKVEDGETFDEALKRELLEETGLHIASCEMIYAGRVDDNYYSFTFLVEAFGQIQTEEAGIPKWTNFEEIKNGCFGEYNETIENVLAFYPIPDDYKYFSPWYKK